MATLSACGAPGPASESENTPPASQPAPPASHPTPSIVRDLLGPWLATPVRLDAATVSDMDAQCLAFGLMAPGVSLVVVDARGEGRVILQYAGEDGHEGMCEATVHQDRAFTVDPRSHTVPGQVIDVVPVANHELRLRGGFGSPGSAGPADQWLGQVGQAGAGIDQVIAEASGQTSPVVASMGEGWFALWFPIETPWEWRLVGLDAEGEEVATLSEP